VFAFSWLDIVSHRLYLPKLLDSKNPKAWWSSQFLLITAFRFTTIAAGATEVREVFKAFYRGVVRMLMILLHDYPNFLSEYYPSLCEAIAPHFVQLRNIILCAAPKNIRLPTPFLPHLKLDSFPELNMQPVISSQFANHLMVGEFKQELDDFLKTCRNPNFLESLPSRLMIHADPAGSRMLRYNMPMLNALILYSGIRAIHQIQSLGPAENAHPPAHAALVDMCNQLLNSWDTEGRYLLIQAIALHLRYPNAHTRYFTSLILFLFRHSKSDAIREQITRVLLERVHVVRPHPWGLYLAFIELLRNPDYSFWDYTFTTASNEMHLLLKSILQTYRANIETETRNAPS
jgi:CCR4-NOT transcription complex subunit 1